MEIKWAINKWSGVFVSQYKTLLFYYTPRESCKVPYKSELNKLHVTV